MKKVCCIYSRNKLDFKKYAKANKYDDVINYNDIISKLIKNDVNSVKPSKIIINTYIRKKLQKALENEKSNNILYALKTLESFTIDSIRNLISVFYQGEYELNLIILNLDKIKVEISDDFKEEFNEIFYIKV